MNKSKNHIINHKKAYLNLILILLFAISLIYLPWKEGVLHNGGLKTVKEILMAALTPDLSLKIIEKAIIATIRTLAYAVTGMSLALVIAFTIGILGSKAIISSKPLRYVFRGMLAAMRSIHELIWAWFFVAAIGLSPYAAVLALGIPYGGTLGRIYLDIINDVPQEPIKALESAGANKFQTLLYGYIPIASKNLISYGMYRLECAVRSSTILSFIGLGGLGLQIQLSLNDLNYNQGWTYIYFLIGLVYAIDILSNKIRTRMNNE